MESFVVNVLQWCLQKRWLNQSFKITNNKNQGFEPFIQSQPENAIHDGIIKNLSKFKSLTAWLIGRFLAMARRCKDAAKAIGVVYISMFVITKIQSYVLLINPQLS